MPTSDELRAALAVAELEEELVAAKAAGDVPRELKERVREARREYREARTAEAPPGGVAVTPVPAEAKASVKR